MDLEPATILIIEDHVLTRRFVADNLGADGYELLEAATLAEATAAIEQSFPDLVLLDLGLPDGDGLELIDRVRAGMAFDPDLPLLVLSGRGGELDRLRGLRRGADDYVVKPFSYQELQARIAALLRRTRRRPAARRLRVGVLELDPMSREVRVAGEPVSLSKKEYALLRALAADPHRVFTREELLRSIWGVQNPIPTRTLDSHAFRLRRKLSRAGHSLVINVWGVGYRLADGDA
jgi:DNA-binding response OmpR family regulator